MPKTPFCLTCLFVWMRYAAIVLSFLKPKPDLRFGDVNCNKDGASNLKEERGVREKSAFTIPETNMAPEIDSWKMIFLLGCHCFRCHVSFRET